LEHLDLGHDFNQPILNNVLPFTLIELNLGWGYSHLLQPGVLPRSLKLLKLGPRYNYTFERGVLPFALKELHLEDVIGPIRLDQCVFPGTLEILGLPQNISDSITRQFLSNFPFLKKIIFGCPFVEGTIEDVTIPLPPALKCFRLSGKNNAGVQPNSLPSTLEILELCDDYNRPIKHGVLPSSLKVLILGCMFKDKLEPNVLPPLLERLEFVSNVRFGCLYNHEFEFGVLPDSLQVLRLSSHFIQPITTLPSNLQHLYFTAPYNKFIDPKIIPPGLTIHPPEGYSFPKRPYMYITRTVNNKLDALLEASRITNSI
jgi:hypothetical protein